MQLVKRLAYIRGLGLEQQTPEYKALNIMLHNEAEDFNYPVILESIIDIYKSSNIKSVTGMSFKDIMSLDMESLKVLAKICKKVSEKDSQAINEILEDNGINE